MTPVDITFSVDSLLPVRFLECPSRPNTNETRCIKGTVLKPEFYDQIHLC